MALNLGSAAISTLKLGTATPSKVMLGATQVWPPALDPDVEAWITAVEAADGQALGQVEVNAMNAFVLGLKASGTWDKLWHILPMTGIRAFVNCFIPLKGRDIIDTIANFTAGDYNRATGLKGNGVDKHVILNLRDNEGVAAMSAYASEINVEGSSYDYPQMIGCTLSTPYRYSLGITKGKNGTGTYARVQSNDFIADGIDPPYAVGRYSARRVNSGTIAGRRAGAGFSGPAAITSPLDGKFTLFDENPTIVPNVSASRLSLVCFGAALLDTDVDALESASNTYMAAISGIT